MFISDVHNEKCIMQLRVVFHMKGEEIETSFNDNIFYDCACTDLLGNNLDDEDPDIVGFEQLRVSRSFSIKKDMLLFSLNGFAGDFNFYDHICGLELEHEMIGFKEILGIDNVNGLYYLVKDIIPLLKDHIKNAKDKDKKMFLINVPTVWSYSSKIVEDLWSGGLEGESDWEYLGILDTDKLNTLDIDSKIRKGTNENRRKY